MDIMTAAMVAQGVMGFKGNRAQAQAIEQAGEYQAKIKENEAVLLSRARRDQEVSIRRNSDRLKGAQKVATAASGVRVSGSPLRMMADTYFSTEVDALRVRYAGSIEQANAESNAAMSRLNARNQVAAANIAAVGSIIQAGSSMASYQQQETLLGQRQAAFDSQLEFQNQMLALEEGRYQKELSS